MGRQNETGVLFPSNTPLFITLKVSMHDAREFRTGINIVSVMDLRSTPARWPYRESIGLHGFRPNVAAAFVVMFQRDHRAIIQSINQPINQSLTGRASRDRSKSLQHNSVY